MIDAEERARRQAAIDFARGSVRFEGVILPPELEAINQRYIEGHIDSAEHSRLCLAFIDKVAPTDHGD